MKLMKFYSVQSNWIQRGVCGVFCCIFSLVYSYRKGIIGTGLELFGENETFRGRQHLLNIIIYLNAGM